MRNERNIKHSMRSVFLTKEEKDRLVEFFKILIDIDQRNRVNKRLTIINPKESEI